MLRRPLVANLAAILTVTAFMPMPVNAASGATTQEQERPRRERGSIGGRSTNVTDGDRATAAPATGPEVTAAAQAILTGLGSGCQVANAVSPGAAADGSAIYEVACAAGPGFILVGSTPPQANNCLVLAESARRAQAADPAASTGVQCTLPENNNALQVLAAYAASASLNCQVDQGVWVGRTTSGADRYEVGCAGQQGAWVEVSQTGQVEETIECLEVARAGGTCQFTTDAENVATIAARLQGSPRASCQPTQVSAKGFNDTGRFYEVKCADDSGFIFRTSTAGAFETAYDCIDAAQIAGGCQLSDVSAAVAAQAETRLQRVTALGFPCTVSQEAKLGNETGGQQRELYEFKCSDRPLGVIAFLPEQGNDGAQAMDCLSVRTRGAQCRFTTDDEIKAVMTSMMAAGGSPCTVEDYAAIAPMDDGAGEFMEVKCDDGRGLLANFPASRDRVTGRVLTCAQASTREYECYL